MNAIQTDGFNAQRYAAECDRLEKETTDLDEIIIDLIWERNLARGLDTFKEFNKELADKRELRQKKINELNRLHVNASKENKKNLYATYVESMGGENLRDSQLEYEKEQRKAEESKDLLAKDRG